MAAIALVAVPLEARKGRISDVVLKRNVFVVVTGVILYQSRA